MSMVRNLRTTSGSAEAPTGWAPRLRRGAVAVLVLVLGTVGLINAAPAFAANAVSGDGTMTVSPVSVVAGSTGNTFTFTFTASTGKFSTNSVVTVTVPAGWTAPSTSSSAPGYTTLSGSSTCFTAGTIPSISGSTITVNQSCEAGAQLTLVYGAAGSSATHVTAPSSPTTATFTTASRAGNQGSPVNLASSTPTTGRSSARCRPRARTAR
jgi:hypothetical protein